MNSDAVSFIDEGTNGSVDLVTLYPNNSVVISSGTSYVGWHKPMPIGYVYIAHCRFARVLQ
jgi:hypothetical protein